jgi:hypothetical protein
MIPVSAGKLPPRAPAPSAQVTATLARGRPRSPPPSPATCPGHRHPRPRPAQVTATPCPRPRPTPEVAQAPRSAQAAPRAPAQALGACAHTINARTAPVMPTIARKSRETPPAPPRVPAKSREPAPAPPRDPANSWERHPPRVSGLPGVPQEPQSPHPGVSPTNGCDSLPGRIGTLSQPLVDGYAASATDAAGDACGTPEVAAQGACSGGQAG